MAWIPQWIKGLLKSFFFTFLWFYSYRDRTQSSLLNLYFRATFFLWVNLSLYRLYFLIKWHFLLIFTDNMLVVLTLRNFYSLFFCVFCLILWKVIAVNLDAFRLLLGWKESPSLKGLPLLISTCRETDHRSHRNVWKPQKEQNRGLCEPAHQAERSTLTC